MIRWLRSAAMVVAAFLALLSAAPMVSADVAEDIAKLTARYPGFTTGHLLVVDISAQTLSWFDDGELRRQYPVSTSKYGIGSKAGSNKTPLGMHYIRRKIGADASSATIFRGRVDTGRIAAIEPRPIATGDDFVTSRIMWLQGLDEGKNTGAGVDSWSRYIYIHGTHEEGLIGQPASHGCIRMRNADVIELFASVPTKTLVWIQR